MKLTVRQIVEALGVVSIVASLIFVGLQLRLEGRLAFADVYANRIEIRQASLMALLESDVALEELAKYRESFLAAPSFRIPEGWIDEENPAISEARRIRGELLILSLDNIAFQTNLGLYGDIQPLRAAVVELFTNDPNLMEFALRGPPINEYTRTLFNEIASEITGN